MKVEEIILGEIRVLRAEMNESVKALHLKVDAVHEQALKTNGRVNKHDAQIDNLTGMHMACKAKDFDKLEMRVHDIEATGKLKDTPQYRFGDFIKQTAIVAGWIVGISGLFALVIYIKDLV